MKKSDWERLSYIHAIDLLEEKEDPYNWDKSLWEVKRVLRHRGTEKNTEVLCEFNDPNQNKKWVSLFALALQDPIPILEYAKRKHLLKQKPFRFLVNYCSGDAPSQLVKAFKATMKPGGPKYKFGVQVPLGSSKLWLCTGRMKIQNGKAQSKSNWNNYRILKYLESLPRMQKFQMDTSRFPITLCLM